MDMRSLTIEDLQRIMKLLSVDRDDEGTENVEIGRAHV
jgi:hypothetical protein